MRCSCGHDRQQHEHYRHGSDCSECFCLQFFTVRGKVFVWAGVLLFGAAFWALITWGVWRMVAA